jgi:hypothetical protein
MTKHTSDQTLDYWTSACLRAIRAAAQRILYAGLSPAGIHCTAERILDACDLIEPQRKPRPRRAAKKRAGPRKARRQSAAG